jgi:hypothetical protein
VQLDGAPDKVEPGHYDNYANSIKKVNAFIDLEIDRANEPGLLGPKPNSFGGNEWLFLSPLLQPPFPSEPRPFKVFTDDQLVKTCP